MNEQQIFEHLLTIPAIDPRGSVSACIVSEGNILAESGSGEDGYTHAENIVFETLAAQGIVMPSDAILYVTLEPCNRRTDSSMKDCTTQIIESGVKHVIFGARDPEQSDVTQQKLGYAGVEIHQVSDPAIIKRCAELFNGSVASEYVGNGVESKPLD